MIINVRNLKNRIIKIIIIEIKIYSFQRYKIKNLREINSKIMILNSNIKFFLLRFDIIIIIN